MMLPQSITIVGNVSEDQPSKTYKIDWNKKHIADYVDGTDAVKQAVDLHLSTERYLWEIYSWQYGSELHDLFGTSIEYAKIEAERMIRDALSVDNRITSITDFKVEKTLRTIHCSFIIFSTEGQSEMEIDINA